MYWPVLDSGLPHRQALRLFFLAGTHTAASGIASWQTVLGKLFFSMRINSTFLAVNMVRGVRTDGPSSRYSSRLDHDSTKETWSVFPTRNTSVQSFYELNSVCAYWQGIPQKYIFTESNKYSEEIWKMPNRMRYCCPKQNLYLVPRTVNCNSRAQEQANPKT